MGASEALLVAPASLSPRQKGNSVFLKACVSGFVQSLQDRSLHGAGVDSSRVLRVPAPRHYDLHLNRRKINKQSLKSLGASGRGW